jgi:hypothetical protein
MLQVAPEANPDNLGRLNIRQPPTGIGVFLDETELPEVRVDSVTWQVDDSPPRPMHPLTNWRWWSDDASLEDFPPGVRWVTLSMRVDGETCILRRTVLVQYPVQSPAPPLPRNCVIYRGGSKVEFVRLDKDPVEVELEREQAIEAAKVKAALEAKAAERAEAREEARRARAEVRAEAQEEARAKRAEEREAAREAARAAARAEGRAAARAKPVATAKPAAAPPGPRPGQ